MASYYINTPLLTCQEGDLPPLTRLKDVLICLPVQGVIYDSVLLFTTRIEIVMFT